jgi:hypothetical protein
MIDQVDKENWRRVESVLSQKFGLEPEPELDAVLFLIGVRELGLNKRKFKKDEKLDVLHIAICRVLSSYGFYELEGQDEEGWPHYIIKEKLPNLKGGEQSILMKQAIVRYFDDEDLFD